MKSVMMILVVLAFFSQQAFADCEYGGRFYPTGTRIGSKVCQDDGTWR